LKRESLKKQSIKSKFLYIFELFLKVFLLGVRSGVCFEGSPHFARKMNLQGKANGRKVVGFGKVRNLQGTENARKDKIESARKGNCEEWNWREMESVKN